MTAVRPYRYPRQRGQAILASLALAATLGLGLATWTTAPATAAKPPTWGPHGTAFGTRPSSGDAVQDCGEMAEDTEGLSDAAIEVVERCLDLHGWTYED